MTIQGNELTFLRANTDIIVAVAEEGAIGAQGSLLVPIREDLQRFKRLTEDDTVIYGRKTLDTFPGGKPLKNRRNLILSRTLDSNDLQGNTETKVFGDVSSLASHLLEEIKEMGPGHGAACGRRSYHIIGGAEIYRLLLPWAGSLHITELKLTREDADVWMPDDLLEGFKKIWTGPWTRAGKKKPLAYRYVYYERDGDQR